MIVVTGPGRSGTSVVAALYRELGYDPGGTWESQIDAGLEMPAVVDMNEAIAVDLEMTMLARPRTRRDLHHYVGGRGARVIKQLLPADLRFALHKRFDTLPIRQARSLRLLDWDRIDDVARTYREQIQGLAERLQVVKDPRFSWTLPVWFAAGANISDVVITTRSLDAMLASRRDSRLISIATDNAAKNSMAYGVGLAMTSCLDSGITPVLLRYPDFLADVAELHRRLPLLAAIPLERFTDAAAKVIRPAMVHH